MSLLSELLDGACKRAELATVFQPIYDLRRGVPHLCMVEALARAPGVADVGGPSVLFAYARRKGLETALDRSCVSNAIRRVASVPGWPPMSVNVHASTLSRDPGFVTDLVELCDCVGYDTKLLVLEIIEHAPAWTRGYFSTALTEARRAGIKVALDDIGQAQSNYRMILEVEADYLKLDAYFVSGCSESPRRRAIIASLTHLADALDTRVVAEGLERIEDVLTAEKLGVSHGQGFVLARPMTAERIEKTLEEEKSCWGQVEQPILSEINRRRS